MRAATTVRRNRRNGAFTAIRAIAGVTALALLSVTMIADAQTTTAPKAPTSQPASQPAKKEDPNDPKAVAVVDRYLKAIGGVENLKAIKDRQMRFLNRKFQPTGVTEMKMARFMKGHYMIREEWELPGMGLTKPGEPLRFLQVYDGENAWVKAMGYVSPLHGRTLNVFVWDKFLDDYFMHWREDGYTMQHRGQTTLDDVPVDRIEVTNFAKTQRINYFFDQSNGLLLKKEWRAAGQTGTVKKELYYESYTKLRYMNNPEKWTMMATINKVFEDGELSLETEYTDVKINAGIADSVFSRPDGPDFEEHRKKKAAGAAGKGATSKPTSQPTSKPASQPKK